MINLNSNANVDPYLEELNNQKTQEADKTQIEEIWSQEEKKALSNGITLECMKISRKIFNLSNSYYVVKDPKSSELLIYQQYHGSLASKKINLSSDIKMKVKELVGQGHFNNVFGLRTLGKGSDFVRVVNKSKGLRELYIDNMKKFFQEFKDTPNLAIGPCLSYNGKFVRLIPRMQCDLSEGITGKKGIQFSALSAVQQVTIFLTIAKVIQSIHAKGWSHCDIKDENILLDVNLNPFITDFDYVTNDPKYMMQSFDTANLVQMMKEVYVKSHVPIPQQMEELSKQKVFNCNLKIEDIITVLENAKKALTDFPTEISF